MSTLQERRAKGLRIAARIRAKERQLLRGTLFTKEEVGEKELFITRLASNLDICAKLISYERIQDGEVIMSLTRYDETVEDVYEDTTNTIDVLLKLKCYYNSYMMQILTLERATSFLRYLSQSM